MSETEANGNGKRTARRLNRVNFFRLYDAVKAQAEAIRRDRPFKSVLARQMAEFLGVPVATSSLDEACRLAELDWEPREGAGQTKLWVRLKAAEAGLEECRKRADRVEAEVAALRTQIGKPAEELFPQG